MEGLVRRQGDKEGRGQGDGEIRQIFIIPHS